MSSIVLLAKVLVLTQIIALILCDNYNGYEPPIHYAQQFSYGYDEESGKSPKFFYKFENDKGVKILQDGFNDTTVVIPKDSYNAEVNKTQAVRRHEPHYHQHPDMPVINFGPHYYYNRRQVAPCENLNCYENKPKTGEIFRTMIDDFQKRLFDSMHKEYFKRLFLH